MQKKISLQIFRYKLLTGFDSVTACGHQGKKYLLDGCFNIVCSSIYFAPSFYFVFNAGFEKSLEMSDTRLKNLAATINQHM